MENNASKINEDDLKKVSGGIGTNAYGGLGDVIYEPTHDLGTFDGGIHNVNYEPTHDLDKVPKV
ncbi:MAG: hypothetical protein IJ736_01555 [Firmicutes bacterium]|nr:hypothetical protein [Bacillota bacterium]